MLLGRLSFNRKSHGKEPATDEPFAAETGCCEERRGERAIILPAKRVPAACGQTTAPPGFFSALRSE